MKIFVQNNPTHHYYRLYTQYSYRRHIKLYDHWQSNVLFLFNVKLYSYYYSIGLDRLFLFDI